MKDRAISLEDAIRVARSANSSGSIDRAKNLYEDVLRCWPSNLEALYFVGVANLRSGHADDARPYLEQAFLLAPDNSAVAFALGVSYRAIGDYEKASTYTTRATAIAAGRPFASLQLGIIQQEFGERLSALESYLSAISAAQRGGRWTSPETTPSHLHENVGLAMRFIERFPNEFLNEVLDVLSNRFGHDSMRRVRRCISIFLKKTEANYLDPKQRPTFLFFPDLPTQAYFPRRLFDWIEALENATEIIRDEIVRVLAEDRGGLEPFLELSSNANISDYILGPKQLAGWEAFFLYRHGLVRPENLSRCPKTESVLRHIPLVEVKENAPEVLFSRLSGGSEIASHRGVTNTRVVVHLPLVVPERCGLMVGGHVHQWREGETVVFDDTFEHSAWNRSESDRLVFIVDTWNPFLDESERAAISELVPAIRSIQKTFALYGLSHLAG